MKYLFAAQLKDLSFIEQTSNDISTLNPLKSTFYDVLQAEEAGNPPIKFCLSGNGCAYLVDLYDGHFEFGTSEECGASFWLHEPLQGELKLIYYRQVSFSINAFDNDDSHKTIVFNFGWQIPGTDVKRIVSIR